jgi:hypothetical protein
MRRLFPPRSRALVSQRTPKKKKAAEPGREALAAFGFCKAARSSGSLNRRHVRLGRQLFERRVLFLNQRFEDSLNLLMVLSFFQVLTDGNLTAQSESAYHFVIATDVRLLQIIEQLSSLLDHLQQSATRMMILLMNLEMLGKFGDSLT